MAQVRLHLPNDARQDELHPDKAAHKVAGNGARVRQLTLQSGQRIIAKEQIFPLGILFNQLGQQAAGVMPHAGALAQKRCPVKTNAHQSSSKNWPQITRMNAD
jgi:hypothetical protein